jgi:hypothetical protein
LTFIKKYVNLLSWIVKGKPKSRRGDMSANVSFYAIKKEGLESAPKAVRDFVGEFFQPQEIFGTSCFVAASCSGCKQPWVWMHVGQYTEGLSQEEIEDCGVFSWFDNHPEVVFRYSWS